MRRFHVALSAFVLLLAPQSLVAVTQTFFVGTCRIGAFSSISAAVGAVPAGSIVNVCAGTYSEQVVISRALTLQGIFDDNSTQVVLTIPSGGLKTTSSINIGTISAQIQVTAGPVNISNITVDGFASGANCPSGNYVGIFYSSGSSGKVNEVETRNQSCNPSGFGIVAENTAGAAQSVTIQNSNVHDFSGFGIETCSDQTPATLTANIKGNLVSNNLPNSQPGIVNNCNEAAAVSGNTIVGGQVGIFAFSPSGLVSGNIVTDASDGILLGDATASGNTIVNASNGIVTLQSGTGTATSNRILNSTNMGILLNGSSSFTVKNNMIIGSPGSIGIEFQCFSGNTVGGNIMNGVYKGLDQVPATYNGVNSFNNVTIVRQGC